MINKTPPEWATLLTTSYPAAKWPQNYFPLVSRMIDERGFDENTVNQAVEKWVETHIEPYELPSPGALIKACKDIKKYDGMEDETVRASWANVRKFAAKRERTMTAFLLGEADIDALLSFAAQAESAGLKAMADAMRSKIERIQASAPAAVLEV